MKVSINSLKKLIDINVSKEQLIDIVFKQIGAVEHIDELAPKYQGIVVAKIVEKNDHPNADKLGVYMIDAGKEKNIQIVAGDKTLEVGDMVAYFAPGTKVPYNAHPEKFDGIITKVTLRDVESEGMLASEKELDISNDHEKVMRIDKDCKPGDSFADVYELNDTVLDIENKALANRGDLFGLINVAREISGLLGNKYEQPTWIFKSIEEITDEFNKENINTLPVKIVNNAQATCSRYTAVTMSNIKIESSPIWLKVELMKVGIRPINNIVDITNYLMYLTSQPLHAFDYDKVLAKQENKEYVEIEVRMGHDQEKITLIDGKQAMLDSTMTVISNNNSAIAVAGVMGGMDTEIDENTKNILIESANFDRYNIRKTSMKLGVFSEAVQRFTKAVDPNITSSTLYKTISLILELIPQASITSQIEDQYTEKYESKKISFNINTVNNHLGTELTNEDVNKILTNINYMVELNDNMFTVSAPSIRRDINIKEDIFEDIGRHFGYNNIKLELPNRSVNPAKKNIVLKLKRDIRNSLSNLGLYEALTYNFVSSKLYSKLGLDLDDAYHLKNSLSPETEFMRTHLLPSLVDKLQENYSHGQNNFGLFEINLTHNKNEVDEIQLPIERNSLAYVSLNETKTGAPYYVAKEIAHQLFNRVGINTENISYILLSQYSHDDLPYWMKKLENMLEINRSAVLIYSGKVLGIVGELKSKTLKSLKLPMNIFVGEFDILQILTCISEKRNYIEPSKFPSVVHDYSFEVDMDTKYQELIDTLKNVLKYNDINIEIKPVDIFSNNDEKKKITLSIILNPINKTLENSRIEEIKETIKQFANNNRYKLV